MTSNSVCIHTAFPIPIEASCQTEASRIYSSLRSIEDDYSGADDEEMYLGVDREKTYYTSFNDNRLVYITKLIIKRGKEYQEEGLGFEKCIFCLIGIHNVGKSEDIKCSNSRYICSAPDCYARYEDLEGFEVRMRRIENKAFELLNMFEERERESKRTHALLFR